MENQKHSENFNNSRNDQSEAAARKWFCRCLSVLAGLLILTGLVVVIVDPYFHYHKPFSFLTYRLYEERYTNDGISRHIDFDAMITGTSMAQNFKPSEMDQLFGTQSVKETFSGAGYQELSQNLERALKRNSNLKTVIWTIDYNGLIREKDWTQYEGYPTYLYDDNPWNDTQYVFNKSVFYHGVLTNIAKTILQQPSTSMDEYSSWDKPTGLQYIMQSYDRWEEKAPMRAGLSPEEREMVITNIRENIVELVKQYPDTTFYLFYTPYSICFWDFQNQEGLMMRQFEAEQIATEMLLDCANVKLYNFYDKYDIICNLDNYRDREHYAPEINSAILQWIQAGDGLVTQDNYMSKLTQEKEFYLNYDYDGIYLNSTGQQIGNEE